LVTRAPYTLRTLQSSAVAAYVAGMDSAITPFRLTDRAAARIAEIAASQGEAALRVAVLAGGCSGFQYRFDLDRAATPDDTVLEQAGARVLIDAASLDLLAGAELDYTDELMGSHFTVRNPNATSSCGCGTSFSVD
jgi:iron-sulfur cluster insertion protein